MFRWATRSCSSPQPGCWRCSSSSRSTCSWSRATPPFQAGAAWLPFSLTLGVFSGITAKLIERFSAIPFLILGALIAAGGMAAMAQIGVDTGYWSGIAPSMMLIAAGFGFAFLPILGVATGGVEERNSGIASGLLTSSQQIGGAVGIAALVTIATSITNDQVASGVSRATALVDGFHAALYVQGGILLIAAMVGVLIASFARESGSDRSAAGSRVGLLLLLPLACHVLAARGDGVWLRFGTFGAGAMAFGWGILAAAGLGGGLEAGPLGKALRIPINRGWGRLIGRSFQGAAQTGGALARKPLKQALQLPTLGPLPPTLGNKDRAQHPAPPQRPSPPRRQSTWQASHASPPDPT